MQHQHLGQREITAPRRMRALCEEEGKRVSRHLKAERDCSKLSAPLGKHLANNLNTRSSWHQEHTVSHASAEKRKSKHEDVAFRILPARCRCDQIWKIQGISNVERLSDQTMEGTIVA